MSTRGPSVTRPVGRSGSHEHAGHGEARGTDDQRIAHGEAQTLQDPGLDHGAAGAAVVREQRVERRLRHGLDSPVERILALDRSQFHQERRPARRIAHHAGHLADGGRDGTGALELDKRRAFGGIERSR